MWLPNQWSDWWNMKKTPEVAGHVQRMNDNRLWSGWKKLQRHELTRPDHRLHTSRMCTE